MEILAPSGNLESFQAALNAGANAVYLGLKKFSARGNAENFDFDELSRVVEQGRLHSVKVYLALNILVFDDEIEEVREYIQNAVNCGVDSIIVQDLGVAALVKEIAPEFRLHASTQMTVTSVEGAKLLKEMGFSRVVLARELSSEEIRRITSESEIEIEVFVHGAHCVCVSGQCYMSSMFGGRSGNRGCCAQPCRLDFHNDDERYALSLKDLSLIHHIRELQEMGVASIKIEGRMKRPEYVAVAVDACVKSKAGEAPDLELLQNVFSRSGFTDGYYIGDYSDMQGIRTKEDVIAVSKAIQIIKTRFNKPYKRYTVDFDVKINSALMSCTANSNGITVTVNGDTPEKAINLGINEDFIKTQISKLGGTIFTVGNIKCQIEPGLMVKAAKINELRREVIDKLSQKITEVNNDNKSP